MAWQETGNTNSHTFPGCLNSGTRCGFERDAQLSIFKKHSEHSGKLKWAALFLVTMKLQVDMAPPWHHSAISTCHFHVFPHFHYLLVIFSSPIKMHWQSSPSWKQLSLKQSVTVISTRIVSHRACSKEVRGSCAADFWLQVL